MPVKAGGPELPEGVATRVTEITVSAIPEDNINHGHFSVAVQWRGGETYAVTRHGQCLGADGTWDYEPRPSNRDDDWIAAHRFGLEKATELAGRACLELTVNGLTVADVLARIEQGSRNSRG